MTNTWRPDFNPEHLYFITTTAVQHKHLFKRDVIKRLIVDTLDCMRLRKHFKLYSFVVMPNHVHFLIKCNATYSFSMLMRDFKTHIANRLIRQYEAERNYGVLDFLKSAVIQQEKQKYKVWEDGYHAKEVITANFCLQKLNYIHCNPCQSHWALAEQPEDYIWSSARFFMADERAIIPVDDARVMFE